MKRILFFLLCFLSLPCIAESTINESPLMSAPNCAIANPWPPSDPKFDTKVFCNQFEEAAYCHCAQSGGMTYDFCKNVIKMRGIYNRMMEKYHHNIPEACEKSQHDIPAATCVDEWHYFLDQCKMP